MATKTCGGVDLVHVYSQLSLIKLYFCQFVCADRFLLYLTQVELEPAVDHKAISYVMQYFFSFLVSQIVPIM